MKHRLLGEHPQFPYYKTCYISSVDEWEVGPQIKSPNDLVTITFSGGVTNQVFRGDLKDGNISITKPTDWQIVTTVTALIPKTTEYTLAWRYKDFLYFPKTKVKCHISKSKLKQ